MAALDYPGHVAPAADLPRAAEGYRVIRDDRMLFAADSTSMSARVGEIMPDFSEEGPEIPPLWEPYLGFGEG